MKLSAWSLLLKLLKMGTGAIDKLIPTWFTVDYIKTILEDHFKKGEIENVEYTAQLATKEGDNYASVMHRVLVHYTIGDKREQISLILKVIPGGMAGEILVHNKLFPREIQVYTKILPKMIELLESVNDFTKLSPTCYHTSETPDWMLLLEDLHLDHYTLFDHGRLLNLEHALLVINKLAKFHACSAVIYEKHPELFDIFLEGHISSNPERQEFLGFFPEGVKALANEVAQWEGYEVIAGKLFGLVETIIPKGVELFEKQSDILNVLNHGDLWVKNIMYRYNNFIPEDVLFYDYQLSYYGSPAIDLNYFLYGSINENVRKLHFKFIVRQYHGTLRETLERLNYKGRIPTLKDIHIELINKSVHAVIAAVCLAPIIFADSDRCAELEALEPAENHGELQKSNIQDPRYKTYIQKLLKEFELSGYLD